jgi:uncharacterized membrane protein YgaE (UPF0421/DUF939 family)
MGLRVPQPFTWPPPKLPDLPWELALKTAVAGALSLFVAHAVGLDFPVYALLAVATTAELGASASFLLVCYRLIGTLAAVGATLVVVQYWTITPLSAGIMMGVLVLACWSVGAEHAARLAPLVFAVGITEYASVTSSRHWAEGRLLATLVGAVVTLAVSGVPVPIGRKSARTRSGPECRPGAETPPGQIAGQE